MTTAGGGTPGIARGFDRLAPFYDALATLAFAGRIHASQVALLPRLPSCERALVVGGGSGRFLAELLASGRAREAVSIDVSPAMTERTRARLRDADLLARAELRTGGLERLDAGESFDLVATHCFLDLFGDAELFEVVARLAGSLRPGGLWLFSDFAVAPSGPARLVQGPIVAGLYAFFRGAGAVRIRRLPDFDAAFRGAGLEERAQASRLGGLLRAVLLEKTG